MRKIIEAYRAAPVRAWVCSIVAFLLFVVIATEGFGRCYYMINYGLGFGGGILGVLGLLVLFVIAIFVLAFMLYCVGYRGVVRGGDRRYLSFVLPSLQLFLSLCILLLAYGFLMGYVTGLVYGAFPAIIDSVIFSYTLENLVRLPLLCAMPLLMNLVYNLVATDKKFINAVKSIFKFSFIIYLRYLILTLIFFGLEKILAIIVTNISIEIVAILLDIIPLSIVFSFTCVGIFAARGREYPPPLDNSLPKDYN